MFLLRGLPRELSSTKSPGVLKPLYFGRNGYWIYLSMFLHTVRMINHPALSGTFPFWHWKSHVHFSSWANWDSWSPNILLRSPCSCPINLLLLYCLISNRQHLCLAQMHVCTRMHTHAKHSQFLPHNANANANAFICLSWISTSHFPYCYHHLISP